MSTLSPKNTLPHPSSFDSQSPTQQRIQLEELIAAKLDDLRKALTDADQTVKTAELTRESQAELDTNNMLLTGRGLTSAVTVGMTKVRASIAASFRNPESAGLLASVVNPDVILYEIQTLEQMEDMQEEMLGQGLRLCGKYRLSSEMTQYYTHDPKVISAEALRDKVKSYHLAKTDRVIEGYRAALDEARNQFLLFVSHAKARLSEVTNLDALMTSPLIATPTKKGK